MPTTHVGFGGLEKPGSDCSGYFVGIGRTLSFFIKKIFLLCLFKMLHNFEVITDYLDIFTFTLRMRFKDISMVG